MPRSSRSLDEIRTLGSCLSGDLHLEEQLCAEGNTFIEARASTFSPIRQLQCFISADASQLTVELDFRVTTPQFSIRFG
jgi:hypothetical protein